LTIDLPHELRAKFNCLFELLFGLAQGDCSGVPQANDARDTAINLREQSVELCGLYHERVTRAHLLGGFVYGVYLAADRATKLERLRLHWAPL